MTDLLKKYNVNLNGFHLYLSSYIMTNIYGIRMLTLSPEKCSFEEFDLFEDEYDDELMSADELYDEGYYEFNKTEALAIAHSTFLPILDRINENIDSHSLKKENISIADVDFTREMQLCTNGTFSDKDGLIFIYGEKGDEMQLTFCGEIITLERKDNNGIKLYFENGKRNCVAISSNNAEIYSEDGKPCLAAFQMCVYTDEIKNSILTQGELDITYSIEVNGFLIERTRFVLTLKGELNEI